jgi:undecaprenyl-diphosphatase
MTLTEAILCGIIQGLAEFLPISSSGHLAIVHSFFHVDASGGSLAFDLLLHLGTLIVVFVCYHKDIFPLVPAFFTMLGKVLRGRHLFSEWSKNERFVFLLIIATAPLALALFLEDKVEMLSSCPRLVGCVLIFNGFVLLFADHMSKSVRARPLSPLGALGVGVFQLAAIIPGLSRSGSTISGGLLFGLTRKDAVRFSFIMSVPAILGANVLHIPDVLCTPVARGTLGCYLIGMVVSMISGFCAMKLLIYVSKRSRFGAFAYYCMTAGLVTVLFA